MNGKSAVERAYELARGRQCDSLDDIAIVLNSEQYTNVAAHLAGPTLRKQLQGLMKQPSRPLSGQQ